MLPSQYIEEIGRLNFVKLPVLLLPGQACFRSGGRVTALVWLFGTACLDQ